MRSVIDELAAAHAHVKFVSIDAEAHGPGVTDIAAITITTVPSFYVIVDGNVVASLNGASAPKLVELVSKFATTSTSSAASLSSSGVAASSSSPAAAAAASPDALHVRLSKLVKAAPVSAAANVTCLLHSVCYKAQSSLYTIAALCSQYVFCFS